MAVILATVVKVGGGMGQGSATEVIHLRLNQPPVSPVWSTVADLGFHEVGF